MAQGRTATKIILILVALIIGGFLLQTGIYVYKIKTGKIGGTAGFTAAKKTAPISAINVAQIISAKAPYFGSVNPKLTVVEFGNFSCPNSKDEAPVAREMMIKYKDKMTFIYRDYPMDDVYPGSGALAMAGKCAAEQGNVMFWAMHDRMYGADNPDPAALAPQIGGLDTKKFSDCVAQQKYLGDVNQDWYDGYRNGVAGTPTFFFIRKGLEAQPLMVQGAIPKATFEQIVDNLLK